MPIPDERMGDRELFERLAAISDVMAFVTDIEANTTLWVNDALVEKTGYTLEDYRFQRFENPFIPVEDVARVGEFLVAFLSSDAVVSGVVRNRFVDRWGGTLHVRSRVAKVDWDGKRCLLYATVVEDQAGDPALEVHERYRSLVEAATDSIVRLRPDLTVQYSNRCFQDLIGRAPVELNTVRFTDLVLEPHRPAAEALLLGDAVRFQLTVPVVGRDGATFWLEATMVRIPRGPDAGLLQAILRDTTEKRFLDERVQRAQKRETLGQMASGIAHDLNNILQGILGSASLAERMVEPGSGVAELLSDIGLATRRAGQLSSAMLAYAGEGNAERVATDLSVLVAEMKPLLASALDKNVALLVEPPSTPIAVLADEVQLRQVVMNLITNAADATSPEGGEVVVSAGVHDSAPETDASDHVFGTTPAAGRLAFVCVRDRGEGMSPEVIGRIFDPFYSTKARGRGLGLAAVLGILERHQGSVRVRSEVGVGTEVEIWLPLIEARVPDRPVTRRRLEARAEGTILVVDDEVLIRALARRALGAVGYEVIEAGTGDEALDLLAKRGEDVVAVLLDQTMPGMGGDQTLAALRVQFPELPVVRTSGYTADGSEAAPDPQTRFLGKPYGVGQLLDVIEEVLAPEDGASRG